jgi:hypothetical protein
MLRALPELYLSDYFADHLLGVEKIKQITKKWENEQELRNQHEQTENGSSSRSIRFPNGQIRPKAEYVTQNDITQ